MKNELEKIIKNLEIENNVNILEFMDMNKIIDIVKDYSFFIQLVAMKVAMSVAESMQLGLIPIVTNVGEIINYCIDKQNSIIFDDLKILLKKVLEVRNNNSFYKEIAKCY